MTSNSHLVDGLIQRWIPLYNHDGPRERDEIIAGVARVAGPRGSDEARIAAALDQFYLSFVECDSLPKEVFVAVQVGTQVQGLDCSPVFFTMETRDLMLGVSVDVHAKNLSKPYVTLRVEHSGVVLIDTDGRGTSKPHADDAMLCDLFGLHGVDAGLIRRQLTEKLKRDWTMRVCTALVIQHPIALELGDCETFGALTKAMIAMDAKLLNPPKD